MTTSHHTSDESLNKHYELANHFNTQQWAIPAVFMAVIALELQGIDWTRTAVWQNCLVTFVSAVLSAVLLVIFAKLNFQYNRVLRQIRDKEKGSPDHEQLLSFYSLYLWIARNDKEEESNETKIREATIVEIEKEAGKHPKMSPFDVWLVKRRSISWAKWPMGIATILNMAVTAMFVIMGLLK